MLPCSETLKMNFLLQTRVDFLSGYPSLRENPDLGDKKSLEYPEGKNSGFRGFCINPGIKIPKLRKIPISGDENLETRKNPESREYKSRD